jgi:hypothetical protein
MRITKILLINNILVIIKIIKGYSGNLVNSYRLITNFFDGFKKKL